MTPTRPTLRGLAAAALAGAVASTAVACGSESTPRTPNTDARSGLVVLAGDVGAARLTAFDERGVGKEIEPPGPGTSWVSAGRRRTLLATMADGSLHLSRPIPRDAPGWRQVPGPDVDLPPYPLWFGTWGPSGDRAAALATDFGEDSELALLLIDPIADTILVIPVDRRPLAAPPVWLDDDRVAIATTIGLAVIDTNTGDLSAGPAETGRIDVSADGSRAAIATPAEPGIEVRLTADWLAGQGSPEGSIASAGTLGALALDRRGRRLAAVWERPDGGPAVVAIYDRDSGWRETIRFTVPGDGARGSVTWLP